MKIAKKAKNSSVTGATGILRGMVLRWYRELKFLSLTDVAEQVGISLGYLSLLESGKKLLDDRLEERIIKAIDSLSWKSRLETIKFAINWRVNREVFRDPILGRYRWKGSLINEDTLVFTTKGIRVEIDLSSTEEERLSVLETGEPLFAGKLKIIALPENITVKVHSFILRSGDAVEESLRDLGERTDTRVVSLFEQLMQTLVSFSEVRPETIGQQLSQILKAK